MHPERRDRAVGAQDALPDGTERGSASRSSPEGALNSSPGSVHLMVLLLSSTYPLTTQVN